MSEALNPAGLKPSELSAVAVTNGPGLVPALLVGLNFAKGLAAANDLGPAAALVEPGLVAFRRALTRVLGRPVGLSGSRSSAEPGGRTSGRRVWTAAGARSSPRAPPAVVSRSPTA